MKYDHALTLRAARPGKQRIMVIGAGTRFLSGISYYTIRLANALSRTYATSVIPRRQLLPTRLYPGSARVGHNLSQLTYHPDVQVFAGLDWFWLPSIFFAIAFMLRQRPEVVVFQWWSGTVLHSFLALAAVARLLGARVVIEFHEIQDPGEADMPFAEVYVRTGMPLLLWLAHGFVIHAQQDQPILEQRYGLNSRPIVIAPHGPYDHFKLRAGQAPRRAAPDQCCNILFFGLIRPYKGVEDLIAAFERIADDRIERYWLTIVGETWQGWETPALMIAGSRYRDRITFVNRYVADDEVAAYFAGADAVALPYHRSSGSGALHSAMSCGLPVVVTDVGGLTEAVARYAGAIVVPPHAPDQLSVALGRLAELKGQRFSDPHSWDNTIASYTQLFASLGCDLAEGVLA
jgi:glycosyltransferase involved in cell wall biosynthesis